MSKLNSAKTGLQLRNAIVAEYDGCPYGFGNQSSKYDDYSRYTVTIDEARSRKSLEEALADSGWVVSVVRYYGNDYPQDGLPVGKKYTLGNKSVTVTHDRTETSIKNVTVVGPKKAVSINLPVYD